MWIWSLLSSSTDDQVGKLHPAVVNTASIAARQSGILDTFGLMYSL